MGVLVSRYGHCLTIHEPLTPSQAASYTKASEAARAVRAARASMEAKQARELGRLASDRDHRGDAAVAGAVSSPPGTPRAATNSVRQAEGLPALGPSPTSATIPEDANERGGGSGGSDGGGGRRTVRLCTKPTPSHTGPPDPCARRICWAPPCSGGGVAWAACDYDLSELLCWRARARPRRVHRVPPFRFWFRI